MASPLEASTVKRENRTVSSTILSNILRDIQLVKAQIGDDKENIRLIKVHKGHVTLAGFVAGAKDAFPREEFPMWSSSVLVQYRDSADDFVTLRDDMEIQMLDLLSILDETVLKFIPLDENNQRIVASNSCPPTSSQIPLVSKDQLSLNEVQNICKRVANTENMVKQLSANFSAFRVKVLQDIALVTSRLEALASNPVTTPTRLPYAGDAPPFLDPSQLPNVLPWCPPLVPYNGLTQMQGSSQSSTASLSSIANNVPNSGLPPKGAMFSKFAQALQTPGPEEKEVLPGKGGARIFVSRDVLSRAITAAESAETGNQYVDFAKTVMRLTAQEACGSQFGLVLQDLQKSSNGEIVQTFCTSAGNFIMKVLHHWASQRWPENTMKKNKFTQTMNLWIRSVFHESFALSTSGRKR